MQNYNHGSTNFQDPNERPRIPALKLHNSDYISILKKDPSTPLPSSRSNISFEDTPRAVPARHVTTGIAVELRSPPQIKRDLEQSNQLMSKGERESALFHWLYDTERLTSNQPEPHLELSTQPKDGKPFVPPPFMLECQFSFFSVMMHSCICNGPVWRRP